MNIYRQAAENVAGQPVSIEPDGTFWTGTDTDRVYLDPAAVEAEVARLEAEALAKADADAAATAAAIAHAKSLGFTDAMIAVMYPNLGAPNV
jgi:hypothetical protein